MGRTTLIFPDSITLTSFILEQRLKRLEVSTQHRTVTGDFGPHHIDQARRVYGAHITDPKRPEYREASRRGQ